MASRIQAVALLSSFAAASLSGKFNESILVEHIIIFFVISNLNLTYHIVNETFLLINKSILTTNYFGKGMGARFQNTQESNFYAIFCCLKVRLR